MIEIGIKSDPIEYRYSFAWLFSWMKSQGLHHLQLGTFFEIYQLPNRWFHELRRMASEQDIVISSVFTAHRELGGFFREGPGIWEIAYRNFARLIEIGGLVGAKCVGCNPGAAPRDGMHLKEQGIDRFLEAMRPLMRHAYRHGVEMLTFEPMSCLAEPPTLPDEIRRFAETLRAFHHSTQYTSEVGVCFDTSHGYVDADGVTRHTPMELLDASIPFLAELHLKNTDRQYCSTFGFSRDERERGVVDLAAARDRLHERAKELPCPRLIAYLELGGPKLGRDYSDRLLEQQLTDSIAYVREVFAAGAASPQLPRSAETLLEIRTLKPRVTLPVPGEQAYISPSLMCADLCHLEQDIRTLEWLGADYLHLDIMDARFTPNMPLGFETVRQLRGITGLPLDAHLMVEQNDLFIQKMAELGADLVSIHVESSIHLDRSLALIRSLGMKAGVALNPATPLQVMDYILDRIDFVLLMTVNPGFAGQPLAPGSLKKIVACREYLARRKCRVPIQVDGNVSFSNIPAMTAAGVDILVVGTSSLFHAEGELPEHMAKIRRLAAEGMARR